jgi:Tfp pilus assembly protein PilE
MFVFTLIGVVVVVALVGILIWAFVTPEEEEYDPSYDL